MFYIDTVTRRSSQTYLPRQLTPPSPIYIFIYDWFIVRFPIGLDFLFITFFLHLYLPWTSLSISSSATSAFTLSNHVLLGRATGLLHSTLYSKHFLTQSCCCLPTPLILVCGGSPTIPLLVHQPAYLSIWPAAPSHQQGMSANSWVTVRCAYVGAVEEMVCVGVVEGA